jgi:predicted Zn-dependent peptidase
VPGTLLPLVPAGAGDSTLIEEAGGATVRRTVLPGGVRVLTEQMPGLRSATFGCWVGVGSRDEVDGQRGATHFLEHLLFKGTRRRSAMDIAAAFDTVGGEVNAVTGKEHTFYYARVLDEDLALATDVICDMVTAPRLDVEDVDNERGVILTELAMHDDDPGDIVHERFLEAVFGGHPLGRPTGGTQTSVSALGRDGIAEHYRRTYRPPGLVVTAAGAVDHDRLCDFVDAALTAGDWAVSGEVTPWPRRPGPAEPAAPPLSQQVVVPRPLEQAHIVLGGGGITATDERRFAMSVLNALLGGGSSSRLFQEVRERRGLAYDVYSFSGLYSDAGYFGLYAGCAPEHTDEVLALLEGELTRLAADGPTEEELARGHGQVAGGLVLGLEDSSSRMSRLGRAELVHGRFLGMEAVLDRIRSVSADDVRALAADLASRPRSLAAVGPFEEGRAFRVGGRSVT